MHDDHEFPPLGECQWCHEEFPLPPWADPTGEDCLCAGCEMAHEWVLDTVFPNWDEQD